MRELLIPTIPPEQRLKAAIERFEILMGELFAEPTALMSKAEYAALLRNVAEEMSHG